MRFKDMEKGKIIARIEDGLHATTDESLIILKPGHKIE